MRIKIEAAIRWAAMLLMLAASLGSVSATELEGAAADTQAVSILIKDTSGASISDAKLTILDAQGQGIATATSNSSGASAFEHLPSGTFQLQIEHPGFATVRRPITLSRNQTAYLEATLSVGEANESVIVNADEVIGNGQIATSAQVGFLGNLSTYETPFSTTSYTDQLIRDQQAQTVSDVLLNDPSVRIADNRYAENSSLLIRGFSINPGYALFNGIAGLVDYRQPSLEGIERVELFKGPSSLINGASAYQAVGGTVNFISKQATDKPLLRFTGGHSSYNNLEGHLDAGRRFGSNGKYGVRANLGGRVGATPIDHQLENVAIATVAFDYRGERLHASLDANQQTRSLLAAQNGFSVLPGFALPKPPKATSNVFDRAESFVKHNTVTLAQADYTLGAHAVLYAAYGHLLTGESYVGPYYPTITDAAGDITLYNIPYFGKKSTDTARLSMRNTFSTGPVSHQLTFAGDVVRDKDLYNFGFLDAYQTNLYHPIQLVGLVPRIAASKTGRPTGRLQRGSVAIAYVATLFSGKLIVIAGLRPQALRSSSYGVVTDASGTVTSSYGLTNTYNKSRVSPSAAALYRFTDKFSVYGNYIEDLQQGPTAPVGTVNASQIFPPVVAKQVEVGAKYNFGHAGATVALYRITQPSGLTNPVTQRFDVNGQQRNLGMELNVFGDINRSMRLLGGLALIDGVQTSTGDSTTEGKKTPGVPVAQLSLGSEWTIPRSNGLILTARTIATASQYFDAANTQSIPSWARLDVGARYSFETKRLPTTFRANINNVTGGNYWSSSYGSSLVEGAPRTILLSGTVRF